MARAMSSVVVIVAVGCGARTGFGADGGGSGTDAGLDARPVDAGADAMPGPDDDAGVDRCADPSEMPVDGRIGDPCKTDSDCPEGLGCHELGGMPAVCSMPCDEERLDSCPAGAICAGGFAGGGFCFDACVVSESNPAYESSCGCAAGQSCTGLCLPGCTSDEQCCGLAELRPEDAKTRTCTATCSAASSRCDHPSAPGSRIGGPCLLSDECPAHAFCDQFAWTPVIGGTRFPIEGLCRGPCNAPPGYPDVCSVVADTICVADSAIDFLVGQCLERCTPGREPCSRPNFVCYPTGAGDVGYCYANCEDAGGDAFCALHSAGRCEASGRCSGG